MAQNRDFCLPRLHSTLPLGGGGPRRNIAMMLNVENARMVWQPDGEKKIEDVYSFSLQHDRLPTMDSLSDI